MTVKVRREIDRTIPVELWKQSVEILQGRIRRRDRGYDYRVPSIDALSYSLGVSRRTVQMALSVMAENGELLPTIGRGTFIVRK